MKKNTNLYNGEKLKIMLKIFENIMEKYHANCINDNAPYYCPICLVYLDILFIIEYL